MYNIEYSANEMLLFKHYGVDDICQHIMPHNLYRMMAEKAFLANEQSVYAEALRRGLAAMNSCSPYRLTPEFDKLIAVSGPPVPKGCVYNHPTTGACTLEGCPCVMPCEDYEHVRC